ncbi:hypothetical protein MJT46_016302 [Ovis ammon polii x Ovis aries]|nr:hypothetical protein MJT46_016302 [Ovis ammon polii x Ovis aries]
MVAPLLILLLSFALGSAAQGAQGDENLEIIDGVPCARGSQPWQVALRKGRQPHCGGVLLGEQWVLTAARCMMNAYHVHMHSDRLVGGQNVKATQSCPPSVSLHTNPR